MTTIEVPHEYHTDVSSYGSVTCPMTEGGDLDKLARGTVWKSARSPAACTRITSSRFVPSSISFYRNFCISAASRYGRDTSRRPENDDEPREHQFDEGGLFPIPGRRC